jgi:hypothetical protein
MIRDSIKATGALEITLYDSNRNVKQQVSVPNLVVSVGKNVIADRLIDASTAVMSHMAVGEDAGIILPLATSNTDLGAMLDSRVVLTNVSRTNNVITYTAEFVDGVSTGAIVEAGIFNASTGGDMLCRTTFPVINKEASDFLTINWNVTIN